MIEIGVDSWHSVQPMNDQKGLMGSDAVMFSIIAGVDGIVDDEGKKYGDYSTLEFD